MTRVLYDRDADLADISDETAAVVGYGIQGHAQTKNQRDSGCSVIVGNRQDEYRAMAEGDGFPVSFIGEASRAASGCTERWKPHIARVSGGDLYAYGSNRPEASTQTLLKKILGEIRDGSFDRPLVDEQRAGYPNLKSKFDQARQGPLTERPRNR